jgi:hypothetical protein
MPRQPFTSRSAGVLFWGAGYLAVAIALGLALAALWPQGTTCVASCAARIEAGVIAITLVFAGGLAGFVVAIWLGVARRAVAPRLVVLTSLGLLVAALVSALLLARSGASGEAGGLAMVRSAWSWGLVVPTGALLATSCAAWLRERVRMRLARPAASARVRRA